MLQRDFDERGGDFAARPYFRAFLGFICELAPPDPVPQPQFAYLQALAGAFAQLTPQRVPGFVYSWLELISHRYGPLSAPARWGGGELVWGALLRF